MRLKNCQICGKKYDMCKTPYIADGYFKWTEVACSPQCAQEYLARLEQPLSKPKAVEKATKKSTKKTTKSASKATDKEKVEIQPD